MYLAMAIICTAHEGNLIVCREGDRMDVTGGRGMEECEM